MRQVSHGHSCRHIILMHSCADFFSSFLAQYNQSYQQPYYNNNQQPYYNNSNNAPPAYTPPPNGGYYGNNDVELQPPAQTYGGGYKAPDGPPPNRT